ncbi:MAG: hypothetical protein AAFX54_09740 [Pseudomonadota bacterium]
MFKYITVFAIVSFAVFAGKPKACEQHMDENAPFNPKAAGKIYFQPTRPLQPADGEVWIDARNGEQFIFQDGVWISRNLRMTISALKSDY